MNVPTQINKTVSKKDQTMKQTNILFYTNTATRLYLPRYRYTEHVGDSLKPTFKDTHPTNREQCRYIPQRILFSDKEMNRLRDAVLCSLNLYHKITKSKMQDCHMINDQNAQRNEPIIFHHSINWPIAHL